jgi:hypothetical protein
MNTQPSTTERANLLVITGFASLLSLSDILVVYLHPLFDPPKSKIDFGISQIGPDPFILGHTLTVGLFVILFFTKRRYLGAFLYCLLCLLPYIVELSKAYHILYHHDIIYTQSFLSVLRLIGNPMDFLVTLLLLVIGLWLLSLTIRPLLRIQPPSND